MFIILSLLGFSYRSLVTASKLNLNWLIQGPFIYYLSHLASDFKILQLLWNIAELVDVLPSLQTQHTENHTHHQSNRISFFTGHHTPFIPLWNHLSFFLFFFLGPLSNLRPSELFLLKIFLGSFYFLLILTSRILVQTLATSHQHPAIIHVKWPMWQMLLAAY